MHIATFSIGPFWSGRRLKKLFTFVVINARNLQASVLATRFSTNLHTEPLLIPSMGQTLRSCYKQCCFKVECLLGQMYLQMFTYIVHWFVTLRVIPMITFSWIDSETIFLSVNLIWLPWGPVCISCYVLIVSRPDPFCLCLYVVSCRPKLTIGA